TRESRAPCPETAGPTPIVASLRPRAQDGGGLAPFPRRRLSAAPGANGWALLIRLETDSSAADGLALSR
ncbi:MAG: hypothetical protein ACJARS_000921, partial [bacterium]